MGALEPSGRSIMDHVNVSASPSGSELSLPSSTTVRPRLTFAVWLRDTSSTATATAEATETVEATEEPEVTDEPTVEITPTAEATEEATPQQ